MADMKILLTGLIEYKDSLYNHLFRLRDEFQKLESRWGALSSVYEGTGAEEFRRHWLRTTGNFNEYIDKTQRISSTLQERIDALQVADSAEGL